MIGTPHHQSVQLQTFQWQRFLLFIVCLFGDLCKMCLFTVRIFKIIDVFHVGFTSGRLPSANAKRLSREDTLTHVHPTVRMPPLQKPLIHMWVTAFAKSAHSSLKNTCSKYPFSIVRRLYVISDIMRSGVHLISVVKWATDSF